MADPTFDRDAAIKTLVDAGENEAEVSVLADEALQALLDKLAPHNTVTVHISAPDVLADVEKMTSAIRGELSAVRRGLAPGGVVNADVPAAGATQLETAVGQIVPSAKTPDITPAQMGALATAAAGYAVAAGVPLNSTAQFAIVVGSTLIPVAWMVADVVIRWSRAKHIFGSKA